MMAAFSVGDLLLPRFVLFRFGPIRLGFFAIQPNFEWISIECDELRVFCDAIDGRAHVLNLFLWWRMLLWG